ncbi:MAG: TerB N-terminal domain-containing protein [Acidobacteriota bacterium]
MLGLLVAVLLAAVGLSLFYRLSPAAKLRARLREALSPFEDLESDVRRLEQTLKQEIESLTTSYIQGVHAARIKAIPVDELKKHATGMRLQALKDLGIRTVADLEGWSEFRVSQVRGVGPKSAYAIVHSVAAVIAAAKAIPIPAPLVPFSAESERQLMQALYRERWFATHVSDQAAAFTTVVLSNKSMRDAVLAKTTFSRWVWKFGGNDTIRRCIEEGEAQITSLADRPLQEQKESLSKLVSECRKLCANRVPIESIVQDFNQEQAFYVGYLSKRFTATKRAIPENSPPPEITAIPPAGTVHVEFGRVVPGPPPQPSGATSSSLDGAARTAPLERLFSVSVGSASGRTPTTFTLPPPPRTIETSDLKWLNRGESVDIQGHRLTHGLIYIGKGTDEEKHYAINPRLSAQLGNQSSPDANGYYSSYSLFSPEKRALYLKWLAEGASTSTDSSFAMLYFYGIERRLLDLLQKRITDVAGDEDGQLLQEVHRLANLFKNSAGSVTQCCLRLSDFAAACALDRNPVPQLPAGWIKTWELPFIIRYGIGWFMRERKPIPMEWALRWAYAEPTIYLRTPATRCPQEYEAAFAVVYRKRCGDGLTLSANKTKLKLTYQPGWPMHFGKEIRYEFSNIPDVAALTAPQQTLKELVEQATAEIDEFSRYLGRNPAKSGSLEAYLNLPSALWPPAAKERWLQFSTSFVEPVQPLVLESLLRELDPSSDPNATRLTDIAGNLSSALVGFEPDILSGARRPKASDLIVLFPLTSNIPAERTTLEYKGASLMTSLSACVALADGHASEDEAAAVEKMIASWDHLHIDLRTRLRAQYRLQVRNGISLANLKSRFANLTADGRLQMALALCSLAAADGNIAAAEVKLLEQIYRAMELDPQLLYSHLHSGRQTHNKADGNLEVGRPGYKVDTARLEALRQETDQVSALLAGVFTEDEPPSSSTANSYNGATQVDDTTQEILLPGLDEKHQQFLAEMLRKASWTRGELQAIAGRLQIMLDGALERINDAAFDLLGEPITEGDGPIYVQQSILEAAE